MVKWLSKPHRPMHKLCVVMNTVSCTHLIDMSNKTAKVITSTACYICTNIATHIIANENYCNALDIRLILGLKAV